MSIIDTLIIDRTADDVRRWAALADKGFRAMTEDERAEWLSGMKGAYNVSDLNRVGEAVGYVAERLRAAGCRVTLPAPKTDWTIRDIPAPGQLEQYRASIAVLREALQVPAATPEAPESMEGLDYAQANHLEQILTDVDGLISRVMLGWYYCGDVCAGEV